MSTGSLFDFPDSESALLRSTLAGLSSQGIHIGCSSWKYPGWLDQIYTRSNYLSRGRFSKKVFEAECLREYAGIFPTVCGDFAFYRGGPILTSALSGIDQALWDIKGKALGVPVYELLGGPTRDRVRVYAHSGSPESMKRDMEKGFTAFKTGPAKRRPARYIETPAAVQYAAERFGELRKAVGNEVDIAIDFHGAISPATAKLLIKALEPYQPMFVEEPCQAQNHDVMADIARGTFLPIATGERVFTKWGFREVLEKKAAVVLQPDLCHAGGITEVRLIAGMAEAYYATIAPHNPLGPISLAAGVQMAASIPNFLCQEQVSLGEGYLKKPFTVHNGYLDLPRGPGLGIELDENAMADKLNHDWRNQESYDAEDGSVVDW